MLKLAVPTFFFGEGREDVTSAYIHVTSISACSIFEFIVTSLNVKINITPCSESQTRGCIRGSSGGISFLVYKGTRLAQRRFFWFDIYIYVYIYIYLYIYLYIYPSATHITRARSLFTGTVIQSVR